MITEDYVSFETAKLLKEKEFKEWCSQCYGLDVRHNGEPIDEDEEYELKSTGRENEIEYVDGGRMYYYGCGNFNPGSSYAAPSLYVAMKWLREVHHYYIQIMLDSWVRGGHLGYYVVLQKTDSDFEMMLQDAFDEAYYQTYEEACEAAIKYCLKNLI